MNVHEILSNNSSFSFENNIFYQKELPRGGEFEKNYLEVRHREGRVYADEIVLSLPHVRDDHPLSEEWRSRKATLKKLLNYLNKKKPRLILEIGCGNGWLAHQLATNVDGEVTGVDVNEHELLQGSRVFSSDKNLTFIYGNIFEMEITGSTFDFIILSSSVQYFPDVKKLLTRLIELLNPSGEIHIVDSPWYTSTEEAKNAHSRSSDYFHKNGVAEMADTYYHHTTAEFGDFSYRVLYDPNTIVGKLKRKILKLPDMLFPWILITHY